MFISKLELSCLKLLFKRRNLNNDNAIQVWVVRTCTLSHQNFALKGSEQKKKGGIGLRRKISAFDHFLLLSDVSIRRKLLKTTYTEERSIHTNS